MLSLRTLAIVAVTASFGIVGWSQTPANREAHHPAATPAAGMPMPMDGTGAPMARMDDQMKTMQAMHDKMLQAKTPEQRNALMAQHMAVMKDSMAMMGGMDAGGMMGKGGMAGMGAKTDKPAAAGEKAGMAGMQGMQGKGAMEGDMAMHHQMMEKRMQMMHAMMQMMMDRMPPAPTKP